MHKTAYEQFTLSIENQQLAFARLMIVANETVRESGTVPRCVRDAIDDMLRMDSIRDQTVTDRCDDMITLLISIDDNDSIVYDTAYPHDWAAHWSSRVQENVTGIVWLYRGDYTGPMAYSIDGLRLMAAIYHETNDTPDIA